MDGAKGYAWFFGNEDFRIFILRHTRSREVPKAVPGLAPLKEVQAFAADLKSRFSEYTEYLPRKPRPHVPMG